MTELYTFGSYGKNGKVKAEKVMAYLNKTFSVCKPYPLSIKDFGDTKHFWKKHWCLQMDDIAKKYTNDINKMRNAATDYLEGYKAGLKDK